MTLTRDYWGFGLEDPLPIQIPSDVVAVSGDWQRVSAFLSAGFPELTEESFEHASSTVRAAKLKILSGSSDLIEFRKSGTTIGVMVGAPYDWSSYYVRVFVFAKEHRRASVTRACLQRCVCDPLQQRGIQRVIGDSSPINRGVFRLYQDMKFYPTGVQYNERYGVLTRYTKFLDAVSEAEFVRKFGGVSRSG